MGKKKAKGEYNDFLEDTRYQNNNDIRTTLQSTSTLTRNISPPAPNQTSQQRNSTHHKTKPKKPPLTHFLCLPLVTSSNRPRLATALSKLRSDVETLTPVPPKAVRPVGTLHLTLGVMSLSPTQQSDATQHLQGLDIAQLLRGITTKVIAEEARDTSTVSENAGAVANPAACGDNAVLGADPESLVVQLRGLVPMQRPAQTSILYAEPKDDSARLLRFAESVRGSFEDQGWVEKDERALRLHATVLNTVYAKPRGRGKGRGRGEGTRSGNTRAMDDGGQDGGQDQGSEGVEPGTDGEDAKAGREERSKAHGPDAKSWMRFDASALIEAYKDFVWAEDVRIDRVQICKMGAKKILHQETGEVVDEEYEVVAEKSI